MKKFKIDISCLIYILCGVALATIALSLCIHTKEDTVSVIEETADNKVQNALANAEAALAEAKRVKEEASCGYYTAYGRYYTNGTVITNDGNVWSYQTDSISDREPYDGMPVGAAFDSNGTFENIEDDIIFGLVFDMNTAIYDELETTMSEVFTVTRHGNELIIEP